MSKTMDNDFYNMAQIEWADRQRKDLKDRQHELDTAEIERLRAQIADGLKYSSEVDTNNTILRARVEELSSVYARLRASDKEKMELYLTTVKERDELQGRVEELEAEYRKYIEHTKGRMFVIELERDQLKSRVEELEGDVKFWQGERDAYFAIRTKLIGERDTLKARVEELETSYNKLWGVGEIILQERDELKVRVEELEAELWGKDRAFELVIIERDELRTRLAKLELPNGAARACPYTFIDTLTAELKRSQTDRDEMVDEVTRLESRLAEKDDITQELQDREHRHKEIIAKWESDFTELGEKLIGAIATNGSLANQLAHEKATGAYSWHRVTSLQDELAEAKASASDWEDSWNLAHKKLAEANVKLACFRDREDIWLATETLNDSLRARLAESEMFYHSLETENQDLSKRLEASSARLASYEKPAPTIVKTELKGLFENGLLGAAVDPTDPRQRVAEYYDSTYRTRRIGTLKLTYMSNGTVKATLEPVGEKE